MGYEYTKTIDWRMEKTMILTLINLPQQPEQDRYSGAIVKRYIR